MRLDILILIPALGNGGTEKVASMLARSFAHNSAVGLVTFATGSADFFDAGKAVQRLTIDEHEPSRSIVQAISANFRRVKKLRRIFKSSRPTIVLSFLPQANVTSIIASFGIKTKVIVSERNSLRHQQLSKAWIWARYLIYRFADAVTVNSKELKAELETRIKCKPVLLPNPLEIPNVLIQSETSSRIILSVGRLVKQKGFDLLLQGFALSQACRTGWCLQVVGDGVEKQALCKLAVDLGIEKNVVWTGICSDISFWYRVASFFVLVSRHEGTSNAMLEAMAYGKPVIVSNKSGGGMDVVKHRDNGLITPLDPKHIAHTIDWMVFHPADAYEFGENARKTAQLYDVSIVSKRWLDFIESVGNL